MPDRTGIAWTDATWNPVRGCTRVSEGCRHCYAETIAARFSDPGAPFHGFADRARPGSKWTGRVDLVPAVLDLPLRWRRPRRIFVNSMSDLFHEALPDAAIDQVFASMLAAPWHTYQVLTKRSDRMRSYMTELLVTCRWLDMQHPRGGGPIVDPIETSFQAAFRHIWLGVSVEDQAAADARIPDLLNTPASTRFLSCEPLLGPVDLFKGTGAIADWIIVGGESGPGARPMRAEWAQTLLRQAWMADVPAFFKQTGSARGADWPTSITGKGDDPAQWPPEMRVQEFPL